VLSNGAEKDQLERYWRITRRLLVIPESITRRSSSISSSECILLAVLVGKVDRKGETRMVRKELAVVANVQAMCLALQVNEIRGKL
jgi:hypothetical protein